jgi:putative NADPH-quinone reductase
MKRTILIFNANPKKESFSLELGKRYYKGAVNAGANAELINLHELKFDLNLENGYSSDLQIEEDLKKIQEKIKSANHLVFIYPVWWGTYPALLKGFIDRTFTPGFAFKFRGNTLKWDKYLTGKTGRLIVTLDTPKWYYSLSYKSPGINAMKKCTLEFCGIKPVKTTVFSPIRKSTEKQRTTLLNKVEQLGFKMV